MGWKNSINWMASLIHRCIKIIANFQKWQTLENLHTKRTRCRTLREKCEKDNIRLGTEKNDENQGYSLTLKQLIGSGFSLHDKPMRDENIPVWHHAPNYHIFPNIRHQFTLVMYILENYFTYSFLIVFHTPYWRILDS